MSSHDGYFLKQFYYRIIRHVLNDYVQITCDDGTVGWGEPIVEGLAQTVETAVKVNEPMHRVLSTSLKKFYFVLF